MKAPQSAALLLLVLAMGAGTASADSVTFDFGGTITGTFNTPGVEAGDNFHGSFSYDPNIVFVTPFVNHTFPAIGFVTVLNGVTLIVPDPEIIITNDGVFDGFTLFGEVNPDLYIEIDLVGNRNWPNWTLPDALNLEDWCCAQAFTLSNNSRPVLELAGLIGPGTTFADQGQLTRLHEVPEPPTILLLAAGAAAFLLSAKFHFKHTSHKARGYS